MKIKLTENELKQIVAESVRRILNEEELKGRLLNPSKESYWRTNLEELLDEVNDVCETLNLPSDYRHQPYIYLFRNALRELIQKDSYGDYPITQNEANKYRREWEYIKRNQCYDTYS
jgi:hypothetical protein